MNCLKSVMVGCNYVKIKHTAPSADFTEVSVQYRSYLCKLVKKLRNLNTPKSFSVRKQW